VDPGEAQKKSKKPGKGKRQKRNRKAAGGKVGGRVQGFEKTPARDLIGRLVGKKEVVKRKKVQKKGSAEKKAGARISLGWRSLGSGALVAIFRRSESPKEVGNTRKED